MKIVIIGGGQAGGWAARTIMGLEHGHEVVLIAEELHPPYERPPLSKEVLLGEAPATSTYMWTDKQAFDARHGVVASHIDRKFKTVTLSTGDFVAYDRLILTTGGRVRQIDRPGALYLRTIEDAVAIGNAICVAKSMLIIGGGWIGLEVAAAARKRGLEVTVVEATERLASRVMPNVISTFLHDLHQRNGVTFHYRAAGRDFADDLVVAGIGIEPNIELAEAAGLSIKNGIVVDEYGRTSDPDIFAAGDVASVRGTRTESWANAQNQAIATAKSATGNLTPYRDIPWFWSNQYDVNFQFLGSFNPQARTILRGDPAAKKFSAFFLAPDKHVEGVVAVNAMGDIRAARKMMQLRLPVDPLKLEAENVPLSQAFAA